MESNKPKIVLVQRMFPFYRKFIFDELDKRYSFKLIHSNINFNIKSHKSTYSLSVPSIKFGNKDTSVWMFLLKYIYRFKPDLIIHEFNIGLPSLFICLIYSKFFNIPFIVWGHGINRFRGFNPNSNLKDRIKLIVAKFSSGLLVYTKSAKNVFLDWGVSKIYVAQNTIDSSAINFSDHIIFDKYSNGLEIINLLFVGRVVQEKEPFRLIEICQSFFSKDFYNFKISVVGSGNLLHDFKREVEGSKLSKYFEFFGEIIDEDKLQPIFYKSDLFLSPGYVGLSINHAFFYGLPVLTFKNVGLGPFHSPEIDYLEDEFNGYILDSVSHLTDKVIFLYHNPSFLSKIRINSFQYSQKYLKPEFMVNNISNMIKCFLL